MSWADVGPRAFARAADLLGLPRTSATVLAAFRRARGALTVPDIVRLARVSERSARTAVALLVDMGLLTREVVTTESKRLAYAYKLPDPEAFVAALRREVARRAEEVERAARELFRAQPTGGGTA